MPHAAGQHGVLIPAAKARSSFWNAAPFSGNQACLGVSCAVHSVRLGPRRSQRRSQGTQRALRNPEDHSAALRERSAAQKITVPLLGNAACAQEPEDRCVALRERSGAQKITAPLSGNAVCAREPRRSQRLVRGSQRRSQGTLCGSGNAAPFSRERPEDRSEG